LKELSELDPFGTRKQQTRESVVAGAGLEEVATQAVEIQHGVPSDYAEQVKFLENIYKTKWNHDPKGKVENAVTNGSVIQTDISQIDYTSQDRLDTDVKKFGQIEFIEQGANSAPDFSRVMPETIDVMSGQGKKDYDAWRKNKNITTNKYGDVMNFIAETYGSTHYLPGLDYWQWIQENPNSNQATELKKSSYTFFPGSLFRLHNGGLIVPCLGTGGGVLKPYGHWLGHGWDSSNRVVLLPKP
jgi:hypothetical protein